MKNKTNRQITRRTPKVFHSSYQPVTQRDWQQYRALLPFVWLLLAFLAIYLIGRLPALRVEKVEVTPTTDSQLTDSLNNLRGQSLFSHGLTNNILKIQLDLPTINSLDCRRGIPGTLKCSATLRLPALVWKSGAASYVVDDGGFVYATLTAAPPAGVVIVEDKSAAVVHLGQTVASAGLVADFSQLANLLSKSKLQFSELYIGDTLYQSGAILTGSSDQAVPFAKASPISALFSFDQPLAGQVATLVEVLKEKHDQIGDHVDLRIPGYAYIQ